MASITSFVAPSQTAEDQKAEMTVQFAHVKRAAQFAPAMWE